MKAKSIVNMTIHENRSGQLFWIATGVAAIMVLGVTLASGVGLSHKDRLLDTASYFLIDFIMLFTAVFLGAGTYAKDFSNRGIAEIAIPSGVTRGELLFWRYAANSMCLSFIAMLLFVFRSIGFSLGEVDTNLWLIPSAYMLAFTILKTSLALAVASFFGCFTRPVIALLATLFFFALGHFSGGLNGLTEMSGDEALVSPTLLWLLKLLRIWDPGSLILESFQGSWEHPSVQNFATRVGWGVSATVFFVTLCMLAVKKRDVEAFHL